MVIGLIKPIINLLDKMYQIYSDIFDRIFQWIFGGMEIDYEQLNYDYE